MLARDTAGRALTPVVGTVLFVGIVVVLTVLAGVVVFGLAEETDPRPEVTLALERTDGGPGERALVHEQGQELDGDRLRLRGVADPDGLSGSHLTSGDPHEVWPVDETVEVVWFGDNDESYVLREFDVDADDIYPAPDEGCPWVDSESDGGIDDVTVDDLAVNCDVETDKVVTVRNDGVVGGDVESRTKHLDADDSRIFGDIAVEKDANLQNVSVDGGVIARTEGVKVDDSTVESSVSAAKSVEVVAGSSVDGDVTSDDKGVEVLSSDVSGGISAEEKVDVDDGAVGATVETVGEIEVTTGSTVAGDLVSDADQVKVLDSSVSGSVATDGLVKLDGATVEGDVYADDADFDCTDSEIDGQDCGAYSPTDPDEY